MFYAKAFLWGAFGSFAIEVITLCRYYVQGKSKLPKCYSKVSFWIVRIAIIFVAGCIAYAYDLNSPLLAIHIGASTPLLYGKFSEQVK